MPTPSLFGAAAGADDSEYFARMIKGGIAPIRSHLAYPESW